MDLIRQCILIITAVLVIGLLARVSNIEQHPKYGIVVVGRGTFSELNQDAKSIQKFLANK